MSGTRHAVIVGAGIAGLAASLALLQSGWRVSILERNAELGEVGAGLAITSNGLAALASIGLADAVSAVGHAQGTAGNRTQRGAWIVRTKPDPANVVIGIHRQTLYGILLDAVRSAMGDDDELLQGALATGVDASAAATAAAGGAIARFDMDGRAQQRSANLIIGADGIRSRLRRQLFPQSRIEYAGSTSWRAISPLTATTPKQYSMAWGRGAEFGQLRIDAERVYWYGQFVSAPGVIFDDEKAAALERFTGWHDPIPETIAGTDSGSLIRHDVWHLATPLPRYVDGSVALIGDAAHAMTPDLGQGANSALEDAVTIGILAGTERDVAATLERYDVLRRPRTQLLATRSMQFGRIGSDLRYRPMIALRNGLMRIMPGTIAERGMDLLRKWSPPER